ncbi:MAG: cytochrome b/b6 domain-containing protein [Burkholderiales bacterium]|nr:cytochrome b/b6 domain-containing protein [Burkholderiales bacterium]
MRLACWMFGLLFLFALLAGQAHAQPARGAATAPLDNATCLSCHGIGKDKIEVPGAGGKTRIMAPVDHARYATGVHAGMDCVACHKDIVDAATPHQRGPAPRAECAQCHIDLWNSAKKLDTVKSKPRLGVVVENIEAYRKSFHAQPTKTAPDRPRAACYECHDSHHFDVPPAGSAARKGPWRLGVPALCGESCHSDALDDYKESIHGQLIVAKKDPKSAICIDCHTSHAIVTTSADAFKLDITAHCGSCHRENYGSYADTYHGQVNQLGYGYTAKCHDCHGSHSIVEADDPNSKVHPDNRLGTCRQCHDGKKRLKEATLGFVSFQPHAHARDFQRYPQMWLTARFMLALLGGVFTFFWVQSTLWFYREWQDRRARLGAPHIRADDLPEVAGKQVRRFGLVWRLAHLVFAVSVMVLILTGMTVFYAESAWAPVVVQWLGGPQVAGRIHRIAAFIMLSIFFLHLVYVLGHIWRTRKTFRWFGPDSLLPNWQDLKDIVANFKWFLGKGPRPQFDRWTYWEKFDYWAVFWGMTIIGSSGLMLAFPTETAAVLPGWVLNVATLVHGEEAFLAAVFLFTVHFFSNHFRPDKLPPPDVVMFTGSVALEEFRREHPLHYRRLKESGELASYLVDAPSRPMTLGSKILGLTLITIGLGLLALVFVGFFTT